MSKAKVIVDACVHIPGAHIAGRVGRGKAACGVLMIDEQGNEQELGNYLAEFRGLIFALDQASAVTRWDVEVWMDSELVIKWMTGEYRMRKDHIRPLFDEAKKLGGRFRSIQYFHHLGTSPLAKRADQLAEQEYRRHQP